MKITFERGDKVLYAVASDGTHKIWEYGRVEASIDNNVYLGNGIVIPQENVLPCMESVRAIEDSIKAARTSAQQVYGCRETEKVA